MFMFLPTKSLAPYLELHLDSMDRGGWDSPHPLPDARPDWKATATKSNPGTPLKAEGKLGGTPAQPSP